MSDKSNKDRARDFAGPEEPIDFVESAKKLREQRAREAAQPPDDEEKPPEVDPVEAALEAAIATAPTVAELLATDAPPRRWLVEDLLPAGEGLLVIGEGGAGKGHLLMLMALRLAVGWDFAGFKVPRPQRVLIFSREDSGEELHRRLHAAAKLIAALDVSAGEPWRRRLEANLRLRTIRGIPGVTIDGEAFLRVVTRDAREMGDGAGADLIVIDPLGRLLSDRTELNSQSGAGAIHVAVDQLVNATGAAVAIVHHVSKAGRSTAAGEDRGAGASSGSHLLEDLARAVLRLVPIKGEVASTNYGVAPGDSYVELSNPKTNYTRQLNQPLLFVRQEGGALSHVKARSKADVIADRVLGVLVELLAETPEGVTREDWERGCKEADPKIAEKPARSARTALLADGRVDVVASAKGGAGARKQIFVLGEKTGGSRP